MTEQGDWPIACLAGVCIVLGVWAFVISIKGEMARSKELAALAEDVTSQTTTSGPSSKQEPTNGGRA
jgi:hypothetical protein